MAALLIVGVVVVVVLVLLYAVDRLRQARSRARLLHAMNDRLTVAAAQIDQEQERRHRVARASAELTSVMPAIGRPPLTLPGAAGHEPGLAGEQAAATGQPAAEKAGPAEPSGGAAVTGDPAPEEPAAAAPAAAAPAVADPAAEAADPAAEAEPPAAAGPGAGEPAIQAGGGQPGRPAENTLTLPGLKPGGVPAPPLRLTGEGTLIMSPVPVPGGRDGAAAGGAAQPEARRARGGTGPRPRSGYQQANPNRPGGS
jgi:hypothetical protein